MADASLTVDTKYDTSGLNTGVADVTKAMEKAGEAVTKPAANTAGHMTIMKVISEAISKAMIGVGIAILGTVVAAALLVTMFVSILTTVVGIGTAVVKFGIDLVNQMFEAMKSSGAYFMEVKHIKDAFMEVQTAVQAAFSPIVAFALPYIKQLCDWLVRVFNVIAMIVAALLKQKTVQQAIVGSTNSMATAAQGALAAFDQINVLQMQPVNNPGAGSFTTAKVDADILKKTWDAILKWLTDTWTVFSGWFINTIWTPLIAFLINIWNGYHTWWINTFWTPMVNWIGTNVTGPIGQFFNDLWLTISTGANTAWTSIVGFFGPIGAWFVAHVTGPLGADWNSLWLSFSTAVQDEWVLIGALMKGLVLIIWNFFIAPVLVNWGILAVLVKAVWTGIWNFIVDIWTGASAWFDKNVSPKIIAVFDGWKTAITKIWQGLWDGMLAIVKKILNNMIGNINTIMTAIATVINAMIAGANAVGSTTWGYKTIPSVSFTKIPLLATGAVIPPNAAYLAMVGDQKSGKNIETPEALMRQIVREEAGGKDANVTINFAGSLASLMQTLKPYADKENVRVGLSLIKSGATG
jgi:hypothetical protein